MSESTAITLNAVGDIMLGDTPTCDGFGVASMVARHGPGFPFDLCREALSDADITFGNLEVVVSGFSRQRNKYTETIFRAQPEAIQGLAEAGFDILSLATNHIMQHGQPALEEGLDHLRKAKIATTGIDLPDKNETNFVTLSRGEATVGFLGYNLRPQQYFIDPPRWVKGDRERMLADIQSHRSEVDFLVLSLHWGDELINYPSPDQVRLAHELIDAGANVILGHHPHILQGLERYNGGLIAYSLGNFVFDMWQKPYRDTIILKCSLRVGEPVDFSIVPVQINDRWQPEVLTGRQADELLNYVQDLEELISSERSMSEYRTELEGLERGYRRETYTWYLRHLFKYRPLRLGANIRRIIAGRLK
jgi:poly-gamma-glutamate synthesis protein (capsule biosynthesis protein)